MPFAQHRQRQRRTGILTVACLLLPAAVALGQGRPDPVQIRDLRDLERAFTKLADKVRPSAVSIRTYSLGPFVGSRDGVWAEGRVHRLRSCGTGAVIHRDGRILTNAHVIDGADEILVKLHDGREFQARLAQADQRSDLAVLEIEARNLRPVQLGDLSRVRQGQWCFVMGNPFGLSSIDGQPALTYGIVEALGRDLSRQLNNEVEDLADKRYYGNLIQTSAAINPGNSGGPLFNINGEMIGVVTAIESRSGVSEGTGFAIPINRWTRHVIDLLGRGEEVRHGYLGVQIDAVPRAARDAAGLGPGRGVIVRRLDPPDGPAAQAKLKPGDIIVEFNGSAIKDANHLVRLVQAAPVGETARVVFLRDRKQRTVQVTLAARPVSPVLVGGQGRSEEPRTCQWRGLWLAEPSDAILQESGLTRERAGLVVLEVEPASDAEKAGFQAQQIVLRLNRRRVRTIDEFLTAADQAGAEVRVEVSSEGTTKTLRMPDKPGG